MSNKPGFADTIADQVAANEQADRDRGGALLIAQHPGKHTENVPASALTEPHPPQQPAQQITAAPIGWVEPSLRGKWHTDEAPGGSWALTSPDGRYRYAVCRRVAESLVTVSNRRAVFVTLRPRGADAETDDRELTRCRQIAKRLGAVEVVVVHLFALRGGDLSESNDPTGAGFEAALRAVMTPADGVDMMVIACWGSAVPTLHREHVAELRHALENIGAMCYGHTSEGTGGQPVSVMKGLRADTPLVPLAVA